MLDPNKKIEVPENFALARLGMSNSLLSTEVLERANEELLLDVELGLQSQAEIDAASLINKELDALFNTSEYEEVTKEDLEQLFQIPQMKRSIWLFNTFHKYKFSMGLALASFPLGYLAVLAGSFAKHLDKISTINATFLQVVGVIACIALALAGLASIVMAVYYIFNSDELPEYPKMDVNLQIENTANTRVKIPYGAKLRLKEAVESGMFEKFYVCRPDVTLVNIKPKPKVVDPAIVGVRKNKVDGSERWCMIVYWDIPKDIDATKRKIKQLRKYKVA